MPNQSSIFTAECHAILTALKEIVSHPQKDFTILSDSKSVLQALGHFNSFNPLIIEILEWLQLSQSCGQSVSFCWCPAHVGVGGNEKADVLAKMAVSRLNIIKCHLPLNDFYPCIRSAFQDLWQFCWDLETQKMKEVAASVRPWRYFSLPRREEVVLSRLHIGHTRLTHRFLMEKLPQPHCEDCIVPLTVRHLLVECPSYCDERHKFLGDCRDRDGSLSLSTILGSNFSENIFKYLKTLKIFNEI